MADTNSLDSKTQKPGWTFRHGDKSGDTPDEDTSVPRQQPADNAQVSWTASEFIANHKNAGWYAMLFAAIAAIAGLTYILTRDWISATTIVIVGSMFAILAGKKPRQLSYRLDSKGITVGDKFYPYGMFKSFTVLHEGAIGCINLLPLKRFMPELSIYYPPDEESKILDVLTASLPNDQKAEHSFDRLMKRIRF